MFFNSQDNGAEAFTKTSQDRIETIFQPQEFLINFKLDNIIVPKSCYIVLEKISDREMLQLRIAEKDERKIFTSTINIHYFNILKNNQSLHVTFLGFIDNLLKILQECQKNRLQISITSRGTDNETVLQFYETHSFKNLIHLSLPIEEASVSIVNYHLYRIIEKLQKQAYNYESTLQGLRNQINLYNENLLESKRENHKLHEEITQQRQQYLKKEKVELNEMNIRINNLMKAKEQDENQSKKIISQLQSKIDMMALEKANALKEKNEELKKNEKLRKDIVHLKNSNSSLSQSNEKLSKEIDILKASNKQNNHQIENLNKILAENERSIMNKEKLNSELKAELQAEKKLCYAKRNAFEIASEEITKANDIISKQATEILKFKKTIDWRTEVALQQELTIQRKEEAIKTLRNHLALLEKEFQSLRSETSKLPLEITSIKHMAESIEKKYQNKIVNRKT